MSKAKKTKKKALLPLIGGKNFSVLSDEEKAEGKKGSFKRSGHLTDQILKYNYPPDESGQLTFWEGLQDETKSDIKREGTERSKVVEGIKLTPSETKVIDVLCKLLHQNSQTLKPTDKNYYTGNLEPEAVEYLGGTTSAPKLSFTLYEIATEYKGGEAISGKDVENLKQVLNELKNKKFCIRYTETTNLGKGRQAKKQYEKFRPILNIDFASYEELEGGVEQFKKTTEVIVLHPIFRSQIDSKFILYPNDITKRTVIAYGSHNVSSITLILRDHLMWVKSNPKHNREILLSRLYYKVANKWMKESRKAKVKEYTDKALETMITLGLLESYKIETSQTTGEPKVVFKINEDFE